MNFEIIKLNLNNYDLSNYIWDMKNCEFTKLFTEQVACKNREPYIFKYDGKYIASCDLVFDYGEYTEKSKKIYLSRLIVKKEYRDKGIGQEVLKQMINLCKIRTINISLSVLTQTMQMLYIFIRKTVLRFTKPILTSMANITK